MWQKIKYNLARFMYGRYGADNLYRAMSFVYIALLITLIFFRHYAIAIAAGVVLFLMIYRMMSKNYAKRSKENQIYLKLTAPFRRFFSVNTKRIKDIKTKRYRVCPHCKATMRLPIRKGRHTVRCRACNKEFKVRILF